MCATHAPRLDRSSRSTSLFNLAIGFYYKSRAGKNVNEFFLSGRNVPWWLAGTSMVATTFAADTPLAVTGMVAKGGIAGNWLWWNFIASGMLTVFFYARLWRRSGVMTDIEFSEIRYSGKPAAFLRGFRALYLGIPINCIILGWVNLAMVKILELMLGVTKPEALAIVIGMIALTVIHLHALRTVGRAGHRSFPVRHQDGHGHRARGVRRPRRRRHRQHENEAGTPSTTRAAIRAGLGAQLRPRPAFRLDADDHVPRLHFDELVVHLVSGRRARRRRLHRAAHVQRQGRKEFAARDAVVQHRALRRAPVALGAGRARFADLYSQAWRIPKPATSAS